MRNIIYISLLIEFGIMVLGYKIATARKKRFGWGIAAAYGLYFSYDCIKLFRFSVPPDIMAFMFFFATVSMAWVAWRISLGSK
ncbi:MAG: hypothetical protein WCS77_06230 [Elusimicrobiaceae bacterium]